MGEAITGENVTFEKAFTKCPGCGSKDRFFESFLVELKAKGKVKPETNCFDFQLQNGVTYSVEQISILPLGAEVPAYSRVWDTCSSCGMVYSTHLMRGTVKKSLQPVKLVSPNREQRRHPDDFMHLGRN